MTLEELYNNITSPSTAKWEVPVTIKRSNPLPLDSTGLFSSLEAAQNYAYTLSGATVEGVDPISYYSQIVSVLDSTTNTVSLHVIVPPAQGSEGDKTKYLQKIATVGDVYSKVEVDTKLSELPQYMILRGTLGEAGVATISELPALSEDTLGDTYKVITTGDYTYLLGEVETTLSAKEGDTITCYKTPTGGYDWLLFPSGDEEGTVDTWRSITVNGVEYLGTAISTGTFNINTVEGNPLQVSTENGLTFSHATLASTLTGLDGTTPRYIKGITVDAYGHISAVEVSEVKVYKSVEVVTEGITEDTVDAFEAATESDIIRFIQGEGVKLVTFHDNIVPVGTKYYEDETLNTELGTIQVAGLTAQPIGDGSISEVTDYGYIKTVKNGIKINHQDRVQGEVSIPEGSLVTNITIDEFGHIASIESSSKDAFLNKILVGEDELTITDGTATFEGDGKIIITIEDGKVKVAHGTYDGRSAEERITEDGKLISAVNIDATGHVGTVTRKNVTAVNSNATETAEGKLTLKLGDQKLVDITEVTTDILSTGTKTLILDGNF